MATPSDPGPFEDITERVLGSAERCFERFGVAKTSVEDIARGAGVSRKTVYRYFEGGRDDVVLTVLLRRGAPEYARIRALVDAEPDVSQAIAIGVAQTICRIGADEHLALLFAPDYGGRTTEIAGRSEAVFEATRALLETVFARARDEERLRPGIELDDATEWVLRIIGSFVSVDTGTPRTEEGLRDLLRRCLAPAFFDDSRAGAGSTYGEPSTGRRRR